MRTTTFTYLDYLPDPLREAPKRRAAELIGLAVLVALAAACAALSELVGRRSEPQSRDLNAYPQSPWPAGLDCRRRRHAVLRARLRRRARSRPPLGLEADDRASVSIACRDGLGFVALGGLARPASPRCCRRRRVGPCRQARRRRRRRPVWAAAQAAQIGSSLGMAAIGLTLRLASPSSPSPPPPAITSEPGGKADAPARQRRGPGGARAGNATTARTRTATASPVSAWSRSAP